MIREQAVTIGSAYLDEVLLKPFAQRRVDPHEPT